MKVEEDGDAEDGQKESGTKSTGRHLAIVEEIALACEQDWLGCECAAMRNGRD